MDCPFCLNNPKFEKPYAEAGPTSFDIRERILDVSGSAFLVAGLGALVYPYVLFITRRHISGISEANAAERADLFLMLERCARSGIFSSAEISIFEHGGSGTDSCSCVDHCHIHIVDGMFNLEKLVVQTKPEAISWKITASEECLFPISSPYLWAGRYNFENGCINGRVFSAAGHGQQYFRRLLAGWVRSSFWNWRIYPGWDNVRRLVKEWPRSSVEKGLAKDGCNTLVVRCEC